MLLDICMYYYAYVTSTSGLCITCDICISLTLYVCARRAICSVAAGDGIDALALPLYAMCVPYYTDTGIGLGQMTHRSCQRCAWPYLIVGAPALASPSHVRSYVCRRAVGLSHTNELSLENL